MLLNTMQTLSFEGHNMAYQCKVLDQSNIVCEYEVNLSTNEKDVEYQGHLKVKVIMLFV